MNNQLEYLEEIIVRDFISLCSLESRVLNYPNLSFDEKMEEDIEDKFSYYINCLHYQINFYLNMTNLEHVNNIFNKTFVYNYSFEKAFSETEADPDRFQKYNSYLIKLNRFLKAFHFYPYKHSGFGTDPKSVMILERILENTESIIVAEERNPNSETKVYNSVKSVIHAVFPSSKQPQSNFIKTAKTYKPDVLIPEIKCAIEYKYAKTEGKLKTTIEQVYADTQGYTGDPDYRTFYAVFYVTQDFWGKPKFSVVWEETKFPSNWKGIYVVGH